MIPFRGKQARRSARRYARWLSLIGRAAVLAMLAVPSAQAIDPAAVQAAVREKFAVDLTPEPIFL